MSDRLIQRLNEYVTKEGQRGKTKLALAINRGERMVDRYLKGQSAPSSHIAYLLAVECGCSEKEALTLARELSSEAKETA